MKKLLILIFLSISISGYSQFIFKNGKSTARIDTLATNGNLFYFVNRTTNQICQAQVRNQALVVQNIYTFTDSLTTLRAFRDTVNMLKLALSTKFDYGDTVDVLETQYHAAQTYLKITDTIKLHNQIATKQPQLSGTGFVKASGTTITYDNTTYQPAGSYMLNSDTSRYISKSQARKDIHDSIAPLRTDVRTLQSENFLGYYPIPPNDTLKISVGNIFSDDGIFISRFVLKDSLGHKHLGENLNILSDINAIYIDYGKNITNASINFAQSFEIGIDLETIYWVIINRNSYRLFLKYFKNSITNQL
jgi:hypothetical protein